MNYIMKLILVVQGAAHALSTANQAMLKINQNTDNLDADTARALEAAVQDVNASYADFAALQQEQLVDPNEINWNLSAKVLQPDSFKAGWFDLCEYIRDVYVDQKLVTIQNNLAPAQYDRFPTSSSGNPYIFGVFYKRDSNGKPGTAVWQGIIPERNSIYAATSLSKYWLSSTEYFSKIKPTNKPVAAVTDKPVTAKPTNKPTNLVTKKPVTVATAKPTDMPVVNTQKPTTQPTAQPVYDYETLAPTRQPTLKDTNKPTKAKTKLPTKKPVKNKQVTKKPSVLFRTKQPTVDSSKNSNTTTTKQPTGNKPQTFTSSAEDNSPGYVPLAATLAAGYALSGKRKKGKRRNS